MIVSSLSDAAISVIEVTPSLTKIVPSLKVKDTVIASSFDELVPSIAGISFSLEVKPSFKVIVPSYIDTAIPFSVVAPSFDDIAPSVDTDVDLATSTVTASLSSNGVIELFSAEIYQNVKKHQCNDASSPASLELVGFVGSPSSPISVIPTKYYQIQEQSMILT